MKNLRSIVCLIVSAAMLLGLAACGQPAAPAEDETKPAQAQEQPAPAEPKQPETTGVGGMDAFSARILSALLSDLGGDNRVYSPLNIYMALAMLAETTDGSSRAELLALLGFDSLEDLREEFGRLWEASSRDEQYLTTIPAASLWLRDDLTLNPEVLEMLAQIFHAPAFTGEMGSESYNRQLRDWINEQTAHLLEAQAEQLSLEPETVLALVTTLYFKGRWAHEFEESRTEQAPFRTESGEVETAFMHRKDVMQYYRGEHFGAIRLPMFDGAGMWLLLPDEGFTLQSLIDSGEAAAFLQGKGEWADCEDARVSVSLPRFDVGSELSLTEVLKELGVASVFDPDLADFKPLTDMEGLFVSQAEHAARVKIDEEGCEAAAYTAIAVASGAARPQDLKEIDFNCDHPFLFAVTGAEDQLLFVGAVNDPTK